MGYTKDLFYEIIEETNDNFRDKILDEISICKKCKSHFLYNEVIRTKEQSRFWLDDEDMKVEFYMMNFHTEHTE